MASITDVKGNIRAFTYDGNGNVTGLTVTDKSDLSAGDQVFLTQFVYDRLDRLTQRRERYSTASGGLFNDTDYAYDSRSNLLLQTDARGHDTEFSYDGLSRLVQTDFEIQSGSGPAFNTQTVYDLNSRVVSRTDPNGNTTSYTYDVLDRLTRVTYADGSNAVMAYDRFGNVVSRTDPSGTVFTHTFDKLNRMTGRSTDPATGFDDPGNEIFGYDGLSRLVQADDGDTQLDFAYNSLGGVESEILRIGANPQRVTNHSYNANDGTRSQTHYPGPRTINYSYDALDLLTSVTDASGPTTLATYDYAGRRVERRTHDGNGTQLDYLYGGLGSSNPGGNFAVRRPIEMAHTVTSGGTVLDERSFAWDADQNKTQRVDLRSGGPQLTHDYTYDGRSRLKQADDGTTVTSYNYDAAGNRTNTGYDLEGPDADLNNYTTTPFNDRAYDRQGNLASFDARAEWYTFDVHDRLTSYALSGSRTLEDYSSGIPGNYETPALAGTWSVTNEILEETSSNTGRILRAKPSDLETFTCSYRSPHDPADTSDYDPERYALGIVRLDKPDGGDGYRYAAVVIEPTGLFLREWKDDALVGELDSADVDSDPDTWYDIEVTYSGTDDRDVSVSWGKRGDPLDEVLTGTLSADLAVAGDHVLGFGVGELGDYEFKDVVFRDSSDTESTTVVAFKYDALGRRVQKTVDPGGTPSTTNYYYDGPRVIEERDGAGAVEATYVYGNGVDEVLHMQRDGTDYYYHHDDLGNIMAVTDGTGSVAERYDYGPFGEVSYFDASGTSIGGTAIDNPYTFTGRRYDAETGLYYYRTRYMDPKAGRFISRDTIGLYGDPNNLGNGQAYVNNNPWTMTDPFGEGPLGYLLSGDYDVSDSMLVGQSVVGAGLGLRGFFWTGPKGMIVDAYQGFRHPIKTATNTYAFGRGLVTDFEGTAGPIWESIKQIPRDPERIGSLGFDAAFGVATAGAARLSYISKVEKVAGVADDVRDVARVGEQMELDLGDGFRLESSGSGVTLGVAQTLNYRQTFYAANPELKGQVVVHHAVEQQVLQKYPGLFSPEEIHSLENLRGIPKTINARIHLSEIRKSWDEFYWTNPNATRQQILDHARRIDEIHGAEFNPKLK